MLQFRYSLRFLFITIAVLGFTLAWAAKRAERNRTVREQVEKIWRLGGHVGFTEEKHMVRPVTSDEWDAELNKTWFQDVMMTRTPTNVLFANRLGLPDLTDKDVQELIAALKQVPMLRSVASVYGRGALAVILTGMGSDGTRGSQALTAAGGSVIAQDEATSVVWGMPGAAAMAGVCSAILPLQEISPFIRRLVLRTAA